MPLRLCSAGGIRFGQRVAAGCREAPDGDHGRAGEGVAVGLLREREIARELGRERPRDRRERAAARLLPAQAVPVRRHDQHRRAERADLARAASLTVVA